MVDMNKGDCGALIAAGKDAGLLRNQLAYLLATADWETAYTMKPVREAYWLSEEWREENLDYFPYYGRGYVQLTWSENYAYADQQLNLGGRLLENPDAALETEIATQVITRGMLDGWFTGLCLSDFITLQKSDFVSARAIVNGSDHAAEIAALAVEYDAALLALGYGVEDQPEIQLPDIDLDPRFMRALIGELARQALYITRLEIKLEETRLEVDQISSFLSSFDSYEKEDTVRRQLQFMSLQDGVGDRYSAPRIGQKRAEDFRNRDGLLCFKLNLGQDDYEDGPETEDSESKND